MKKFISTFALMLAIVLSIGVVGCGKDKIDEPTPVTPTNPNPGNNDNDDPEDEPDTPTDDGIITGTAGPSVKWKYTIATKTIEFTGTGRMTSISADETTNGKKYPWREKDLEIEKVIINQGITNVPYNAFGFVGDLYSVSLPNTIEEIEGWAFAGNKLKSIDIPVKVKTIGPWAFWSSNEATAINIPKDAALETISEWAFADIFNKIEYLELSQNVKTVGDNAFEGTTIGNIKLNDKLKDVGLCAFNCHLSGTLEIPNSVEVIKWRAFGDEITKIVIGTGLKEMGNEAFDCPYVSSGKMYINLSNPPKITGDGEKSVIRNSQSKWELYVPVGCKKNYENVAPWSNFRSIKEDSNLQGAITGQEGHPRGPVSASLSGSGTESSPYLIKSAADLRYVCDQFKSNSSLQGKYFKQTANITINNINIDDNCNPPSNFNPSSYEIWVPIGTETNPFKGHYDGGGYTISGVYYDADELTKPEEYIGLFGYCQEADLKNISISHFYLNGRHVGGILATDCKGRSTTIFNCKNINSILKGSYHCAGIGAYCTKSKINRCLNRSKITGEYVVGGIAGKCRMVMNCINFGNVSGEYAGGIICATYDGTSSGGTTHSAYTTNNINRGFVEGTKSAGGIDAGHNTVNNAYIIDNLNIGDVVGSNGGTPGAIVGYVNPNKGYYYLNYNYYLDSSCPNLIGGGYKYEKTGNKSASSSELKSESVLNALNANRYNEDCCAWKKGSDGYPTLEWYY